MPSATAQRIRPGRTAHREWFARLDADSKATVKANVQSMIDDGVDQSVAWDKVYDSDQQPVVEVSQQATHDAIVEALNGDSSALEQIEDEPQSSVPKGARIISTKGGKLPEHLRTALAGLKSTVDDKGELTIVRGEQQRVVNALRTYVGPSTRAVDGPVPAHVAWTIESVIGKVRAEFPRVIDDKGDNINVRAINAMTERAVDFEVVMRSDGSPMYKVGDVTMSARDALKQHSDPEAQAS